MSKTREEFEVWYSEHKLKFDPVMIGRHIAWQAWQAAIASVVVELPYESFGVTDSEIKKALDKAGIKWTE